MDIDKMETEEMNTTKFKQPKKIKNDYLFAIISYSLCITLVFLPLNLFKEFIKSSPLWFQPILIIIFGISGIGLYVILGFRLREIQLKLENDGI